MIKLKISTLFLGAVLFTGMGATVLNAEAMKCGAGKCGKSMKASAAKCGKDKKADTTKSDAKKAEKKAKKAMKCGAGKCG